MRMADWAAAQNCRFYSGTMVAAAAAVAATITAALGRTVLGSVVAAVVVQKGSIVRSFEAVGMPVAAVDHLAAVQEID